MVKIDFVETGIASRIGDTILINRRLPDFDLELYRAILQHEQAHSSNYTTKDISLDLRNKELDGVRGKYYRFILKHPSSWLEFFPFTKYQGKLIINPTLLFFYFLAILILLLLI